MNLLHSYVTRRIVAGLVDAAIVMLAGAVLTYLIWLSEAAFGLTDLGGEHFVDVAFTMPVYFIDGVCALAAPLCAVHFIASEAIVGTKLIFAMILLLSLSIVNWLYHAISESSPMMSTPGKRAVGLAVRCDNGERASFGRASLRHFNKMVSAAMFFLGFLIALTDQKKRTLHDRFSHCLVVDKQA